MVENAVKELDKMHLKDLINSVPHRENDTLVNKWYLFLLRGFICYGNITFAEYKERLKQK